jgi:NAD(P)H dehydrogenase (quinone)
MSDVNVLVVFYSRYGQTEKVALAAGLGAMQAEANIRLRRLADVADVSAIDADAAWRRNLDRMNRDYVVPRPADPVWADVIVLAAPNDSFAEVVGYVTSLPSIGAMSGKLAAPLTPGNDHAILGRLYAAAGCAGLVVAPLRQASGDSLANARAFGHETCRLARAMKGVGQT